LVGPAGPAGRKRGRAHQAATYAREAQLGLELQRAREEVQTIREEMQTSQEELKSTNEELQSTNEEMQSTNEELTTSREEMQSLNEELQTVNHELQAKVDELSRSNNDMKNLLNSTDIATLFLDGDLNVRRFTTPTARIIKLIQSDIGRPMTDIASDLEYPDLADDAREVLQTLMFKEKQVTTRDGRWFRVRVMPYRTIENMIDGLVITFTDVKVIRASEEFQRGQADDARRALDEYLAGTSEAYVGLSTGLAITAFNHAAEEMFRRPPAEVVGRGLFEALPVLRGTALEEMVGQAPPGEAPAVLELHLDDGALKGRYDVRMYQQRDIAGLALFFVRKVPAQLEAGMGRSP
jgi:two-component system CheB/CheR fusion protein